MTVLHNQIIFESTNNIKTKKDQYKQIKKEKGKNQRNQETENQKTQERNYSLLP